MRYFYAVALLICPVFYSAAQTQPIRKDFSLGTSLGFTENKGQIISEKNDPVLYQFSAPGFCMNLRRSGFSYEFVDVEKQSRSASEAFGITAKQNNEDDPDFTPSEVKKNRIDFDFQNCNKDVQITAFGKSTAYLNYFLRKKENQTATHVCSYSKVIYRNLYPGIDAVFQFTPSYPHLHYEFVVHPGADLDDIQLLANGCRDIFVNECGELITDATIGFCRELKPYAFTEDLATEVPCSFRLKDHLISFEGQIHSDQTIIIDPNILWSTYYGGTGDENVSEVTVDTSGNPIVVGYTSSTTGLTTSGSWQENYYGGDSDFFIMHFSSDGTLKWCTYFGGDSADLAYAGAVDKSGNIYALGSTNSQNGIAYGNAYHPNYAGGNGDMVAAKFDSAGILQWATYGGGNAQDDIRSGTIDAHGNLITVGFTKSDTGIATPGAYQETPQDSLGGDAHIEKWTSAGQRVWGTYFGGNESDRAHSVTVDPQGNICLAGTTSSTSGLATNDVSQPQFGGSIDLFLAKCDSSGFRIWASYLGGADLDRGRGIVTDALGNIYVTGYTYSEDNISTPGAFQEYWHPGYTSSGNRLADGLMAKFSPSGQKIWGTYYGGEGDETLRSIKLDNSGHLYVFGSTSSDSIVATPDAYQPFPSLPAYGNGLLAKFDTSGNRIWGTYFSDSSDCAGVDMEWDPHGFLYLAGTTQTSGFFITPNALQYTYAGGATDAFVTKLYPGEDCFDQFESNDSIITAHKISTAAQSWMLPYSASLNSPTDQDWYSFKTSAVYNYFSIQLSHLPADYDLYAFDSTGQLVGQSHNAGLDDELINVYYGLGNVETFYLKVSSVAGYFDVNDCYALQVSLYIDSIPSQIKLVAGSSLSIFPNPASDHASIQINEPFADGSLNVFDAEGRLIYETPYLKSSNLSLEVSTWSEGLYLLKVTSGDKTYLGKLVVMH